MYTPLNLPKKLKVQNNSIFITSSNGMEILDISLPSSPQSLSFYDINSMVWPNQPLGFYLSGNFKIANDYAYLPYYQIITDNSGDNQGELYGYELVNISNLSSPEYLSNISTDEFSGEIRPVVNIKDNIRYFWDGCSLIDGTTEGVNQWSSDSCSGFIGLVSYLNLNDSIAFEWGYDQSLRVMNILNPEAPIEVSELNLTGYAIDSFLKENSIILSLSTNTVQSIDISNPEIPTVSASYNISNTTKSLAMKDKTIYMVERINGNESQGQLSALNLQKITQTSKNLFEVTQNTSHEITFNYTATSIIEAQCLVTSGNCTISLQPNINKASVIWNVGSTQGDHELALFIGNSNYYISHREKVRIISK